MAAKEEGLIKEVKIMLRSVLVSSKGGVDENFLLSKFQVLCFFCFTDFFIKIKNIGFI